MKTLSAVPANPLQHAPSIRSRLVLLVLACILPAALMAVAMIWYDYQQSRDNFVHSAMATARANALEIDKELAMVESALVALATSPGLAANDLRAFDAQARKLGAQQNIFNIVLEDAAGQQLINTFLPYGQPLPRDPQDQALRFIMARDSTFISSLFVGPVSSRHIVSVGIPVRGTAGQRYALTATIAAERFEAVLRQQRYPAHWVTSVIDRNGLIVARSQDMKRFMGKQAIPQVMQRLRQRSEGAFETQSLDGVPILAVLAQASNSEWTVVIGIPLDQLGAEMNRKLWSLLLATAGLLGSSLFFAWRIGTRIRRSLAGLIPPALALGAGERVQPASYGLREADEVADAMVKASAMLQQARHQATHDVLTGIANRAMFTDFLERQIAIASRSHAPLSVLYLDLDNFKTINDTYGHAAGDELLISATARLTSQLRKADVAARLGGDEFAVVLCGAGAAETANVVDKLGKLMAEPYVVNGIALQAAASIGAAVFPQAGATLESLLAAADDAMYQAKAARKAAALSGVLSSCP
ncbi:diguanylate cyclase domain-containing protein [Pseudoduganella sp. UC29_71]|uniref:bifunctional diguanylate cyclase/phosphodiesterase n=1 Tax=Pseudoduganella sp. UC29_71 TaxID=3350174 RepID=UPI0036713740